MCRHWLEVFDIGSRWLFFLLLLAASGYFKNRFNNYFIHMVPLTQIGSLLIRILGGLHLRSTNNAILCKITNLFQIAIKRLKYFGPPIFFCIYYESTTLRLSKSVKNYLGSPVMAKGSQKVKKTALLWIFAEPP